jgi:hypothetical protein
VKGETLIHWSSTGVRTTRGQAATELQAWEQAIVAALAVCGDTGAVKPVLITVDTEPAQLYPAVDPDGQFNEPATRTITEQLLAQIRQDLTPENQTSVQGRDPTA